MRTVKQDVEGMQVEYGNSVDGIRGGAGGNKIVYMNEDYGKRYPPRKVIEEMKRHDYYFVAPIMNGTPGDNREGFEFKLWE